MESEICPVCGTAANVTEVDKSSEELYCAKCESWHFYGRLRNLGTGGGKMKADNVTYILGLIYEGKIYIENYNGGFNEIYE